MKKITLLLLFLFISVSNYSQVVMATEGFDTATAITGPLPATWSLPTGNWTVLERNSNAAFGTGQSWGINAFATGIFHSPTQCASVSREQINQGNTSEDFLVTPMVHINAAGTTELHFWTRMFTSGNQGTIFKIMIAPGTADPTLASSYSALQQWTELDLIVPTSNFNVWTEKTVALPAFLADQDVYIAFVKEYTQPTPSLDGDRWLIDDVGIASQCTAPTPLTTNPITSTTATLNWTNPAGATGFTVTLNTVPAGTPVVYSFTTPPYTLTGLTPNTTYNYTVQGICSDTGFSSPASVVSANFTTQIAPPVCGGNLVDSGGVAGNYSNNENLSTTVTPNPGDVVTVTFTAFNTQAGSDFLKIYDGPDTSFPLIANLSGTALPPSFTSTAANGQLTFVFTSNGTTVAAGYAANITCGPAPACRIPTAVTTSAITTTSVQLNWTQPANPDTSVASTFDIYAVTCGSPAPTASTTPTANDVTAIPGPTLSYVLGGLTSGSCYDIYIRAVCTTNSAWTPLATTISTLVAPPICGGNFVDTGGLAGNYGNNETLTTVINPVTLGDAVTVTFTAFNTQAGTDTLQVYDGNSAVGTTLLATLSGTTLPPSFISTHPSGSLTFVFTSNGTTNAAGWIANVTCAPQPTCAAPTNLTNSVVTHNSVSLNWVQAANPDASIPASWDVIALPCGAPPPGATPTTGIMLTAGAHPFTFTGLTPLTCYDIYVRSACPSAWTGPTTITTLAAPPECGGNYVDAGGTTANYADSSDITTVICPTTPGDVVTVTFTAFNTEANWDGIYVYNGNSAILANQISSGNPTGNGPLSTQAGAFWGTTIPCPFTSTSADGCLTFVFKSDTSINRPGWLADVTCAPAPSCSQPISVTAPSTTVTHNSAVINWTQPANPDTSVPNTWQVLALPCNSPAPAPDATGFITVTTAPPFVLPNLTPTTCYDVYVRAVCGTGTSAWSCPKVTFTTGVAPPECDGVYVDIGGPTANYPTGTTDSIVTICPDTPGDAVTVTFTSFATEATWDGIYVFDGNTINAPQIPSANPTGNGPLAALAGAFWGTLTGANLPGPFTSSSSDGCLTFRFRTDGGGVAAGWVANVTCDPAPNCMKPLALTATQITSTSALLGWTEPSPTTVTQWEVLVLPFPSPNPLPSTTGQLVSSNPALITGLLPATQYSFWVRGICPAGGTSLWSSAGTFQTLIINDNCDGAIFAPVNGAAVCQQVTPGTISGATASLPAPAAPCVGNANDDVWFQFIASNLYLNVALQNVTGSTTNLNFAVYSGNCGALTQVFCSTANNLAGVLNNLVVGQTYYIRVYSNSATPQTVNFELCISTPSTCPTGSTVCSLTNYANTTGVTSLGTIGCLNTSPNPAYFTVQVATTGPINFLLTQSTTQGGTPDLDVDYAAWGPFPSQAAACTAISGGLAPGIGVPVTQQTGCSYSAAATETLNIANAVAGQFYIVLITNFSDDPGFINLTQTNSTAPGHGTTNCCPDAFFTYTPSAFCRVPATPNPTPQITTGSVSGVFSSSPGLVFVDSGTNTGSSTGQIDIMASTAGNYLITNTTLITPSCATAFTRTYTINITEPTTATITYGTPAAWCQSVTALQPVTQSGTPGGSYSAVPNIGLSIDPTTGTINPNLSSPGVYQVVYGLPGSVCTLGNPTTQVEIYPLPNIPYQAPVAACDSYLLPALTVGDYYTTSQLTGPATTPVDITIPITTTQTFYVYAISANGCPNEKSFTVTINTVPDPVVTVTTQPTCAVQTGVIEVNSPLNAGGSAPTNLFISEVTDANSGSLTYVEIYNGTGAPVNLANYKLRTFNNGLTTVTVGCDNTLSGTLANNSVHVVSVGTSPITTGVVPNQTFNGCTGINQDDCIKLTTLTNTVIDVFGRTDGIAFTPSNQPGYTYRRLASAPHPSTTWNAADWTALDPEDYTNVGSYAYLTSSYEYALDSNPYQSSTTFSGALVTPGSHTITAHDLVTGCYSDPVTVTLDVVDQNPSDTDFSYGTLPVSVCILSATNPMPIPTNPGFTTGGQYTLDPSTPTGLALDPNTGEIDLNDPLTVPGTYTINYSVLFNPTTCLSASTSSTTITIAPTTLAEVGFDYNGGLDICQIAQATVSPQLATGFVTGGTFTISPTTGPAIDPSTGVLSALVAGSYDVTYHLNDDPVACTQTPDEIVHVVITAPTNANVTFTYPTPVCVLAQTTLTPSAGFTTGGTFTISPTTGVTIDGSTGVVTLGPTASGTYNVSYSVPQDNTICRALTATTTPVQFVINAATAPVVGFHYDSPVCAGNTVNPMPILDAGFTTGGTFGPSSLVDTATGEVTGTLTPGQDYTITYTLLPNTVSCVNGNNSQATISAAAPIEVAVTGECISNQFTLTANPVNSSFDPTAVTYEWTNPQGVAVGNAQTYVIAVGNEGLYTVTVELNGCSGSDSDTFNSVGCQIQRGISVNDDNFNDTFNLTGFDVKQLTIFNRLGMKVYSRANYVNEWGGKSDDGDELPDGTYFYVIDTNAGKTETGWIYINRAQ